MAEIFHKGQFVPNDSSNTFDFFVQFMDFIEKSSIFPFSTNIWKIKLGVIVKCHVFIIPRTLALHSICVTKTIVHHFHLHWL